MKKRYRNTAFLVELLINILVFSISCAVLVGLFGKAAEMARHTREESFASGEVQRLVEVLKARGPAAVQEEGGVLHSGTLVCRYDEDWNITAGEVAYVVRLQLSEAPGTTGTLHAVQASAESAKGRALCTYSTAYYQPDAMPAGKAGDADV